MSIGRGCGRIWLRYSLGVGEEDAACEALKLPTGKRPRDDSLTMKTTETPCRWRPRKHPAGEDHGNTVQMRNMETPCRQIHQPILLPKCQETWNHAKPTFYFQILKGCKNFLLKSVSSQQKMQMLHTWIIWQEWPWDSKALMVKCLTLHEDHVALHRVCGVSCGTPLLLMFSFWWEVKGLHFLMHFFHL